MTIRTPLNINVEIPVADILALHEQNTVKHFICHHVAFMLHDRLMAVPGFEEFYEDRRKSEYQAIPQYQTAECAEMEIRSGNFYYLHKNHHLVLDTQVVFQLNQWYAQIYGEMEFLETSIWDVQWQTIALRERGETGSDYFRRCRKVLLENILKLDPQAVLTIKL